ncbi:MAG: PIN domain-containing protein [Methanosarcinales archaeon]
MRLSALPIGSEIFIDSNIFTYHLSGHEIYGEVCRNFLRRVERKEYIGYINDIVISEVMLNFLKSELFRLRRIEPSKVVREIRRDHNLIELVNFKVVVRLFEALDLEVISSNFGSRKIASIMKRYKLLPNDSINIATMRKYDIHNIATNDADFERVRNIKVWKPR